MSYGNPFLYYKTFDEGPNKSSKDDIVSTLSIYNRSAWPTTN